MSSSSSTSPSSSVCLSMFQSSSPSSSSSSSSSYLSDNSFINKITTLLLTLQSIYIQCVYITLNVCRVEVLLNCHTYVSLKVCVLLEFRLTSSLRSVFAFCYFANLHYRSSVHPLLCLILRQFVRLSLGS